MGFLLYSVWDSAFDWSHYKWESGEMETKFILSEILKEESTHNQQISTSF